MLGAGPGGAAIEFAEGGFTPVESQHAGLQTSSSSWTGTDTDTAFSVSAAGHIVDLLVITRSGSSRSCGRRQLRHNRIRAASAVLKVVSMTNLVCDEIYHSVVRHCRAYCYTRIIGVSSD